MCKLVSLIACLFVSVGLFHAPTFAKITPSKSDSSTTSLKAGSEANTAENTAEDKKWTKKIKEEHDWWKNTLQRSRGTSDLPNTFLAIASRRLDSRSMVLRFGLFGKGNKIDLSFQPVKNVINAENMERLGVTGSITLFNTDPSPVSIYPVYTVGLLPGASAIEIQVKLGRETGDKQISLTVPITDDYYVSSLGLLEADSSVGEQLSSTFGTSGYSKSFAGSSAPKTLSTKFACMWSIVRGSNGGFPCCVVYCLDYNTAKCETVNCTCQKTCPSNSCTGPVPRCDNN